jgi:hypothetical protein
MAIFKNELGYEFELNGNWQEIKKEDYSKYNIPERYTNYMVNFDLQKEFYIVYDGYLKESTLEEFFNLCSSNMAKAGMTIFSEEKFVGVCKSGTIEAYKTYAQFPNGFKQTSYFFKLNKAGAVGCITIPVKEDHDENEAIIVGVLNSWNYL